MDKIFIDECREMTEEEFILVDCTEPLYKRKESIIVLSQSFRDMPVEQALEVLDEIMRDHPGVTIVLPSPLAVMATMFGAAMHTMAQSTEHVMRIRDEMAKLEISVECIREDNDQRPWWRPLRSDKKPVNLHKPTPRIVRRHDRRGRNPHRKVNLYT